MNLKSSIAELIGTFTLCFAGARAIIMDAHTGGGVGLVGIGLTITFLILAIGPLTGAAMNPARHLGTAVFGGEIGNAWIYLVEPVIGAVLSFLVCCRVLENGDGEG